MKTPLLLKAHDIRLVWGEEHWVVSARQGAASRVENGIYRGKGLDEVVAIEGVNVTGTKSPDPKVFPLLMKVIDAKTQLSLQVHPNRTTAYMLGGEPKSEAWYVIDADRTKGEGPIAGAILAGLEPSVTPESFFESVLHGGADRAAVRYEVKPGDMCYIPGGTVHAIGGGVRIFEVQETSESVYRLFDWNRSGLDGKARQLHIARGLSAINWRVKGTELLKRAIGTPFFTMRELDLDGKFQRALDTASFRAYFVVDGEIFVSCGGETVSAGKDGAILVPADAEEFVISGKARIVVTTL
jgi:mannose-6-phosphate isomerase